MDLIATFLPAYVLQQDFRPCPHPESCDRDGPSMPTSPRAFPTISNDMYVKVVYMSGLVHGHGSLCLTTTTRATSAQCLWALRRHVPDRLKRRNTCRQWADITWMLWDDEHYLGRLSLFGNTILPLQRWREDFSVLPRSKWFLLLVCSASWILDDPGISWSFTCKGRRSSASA